MKTEQLYGSYEYELYTEGNIHILKQSFSLKEKHFHEGETKHYFCHKNVGHLLKTHELHSLIYKHSTFVAKLLKPSSRKLKGIVKRQS